jgi:WD40 repeat protein
MNKIFTATILLSILLSEAEVVVKAQLPQLTVQTGHTDEVTVMEFSRDGRFLASAGKDNIIIIWDFNLGKQIKRLQGHTDAINSMKFFNSDSMLVSGSDDGQLLIWDLNNESVLQSAPQVKKVKIVSLDISPDETSVIFCANPSLIGRWNLKENKISDLTREFTKSPVFNNFQLDVSDYVNIDLSDDGYNFFISKTDGFFFFDKNNPGNDKLVRVATKKTRNAFIVQGKKVRSVLWSLTDSKHNELVFSDIIKNRKKLFSKLTYPEVVKWNMTQNKNAYSRASLFNKYKFTSGAISPDGKILAAGNEDNNIYLWDFVSGKGLPALTENNPVKVVLFHPVKKNIIVSSDSGRDIYIWDIEERKVLRKLSSTTYPITAVAVNKAEDIVAIASTDKSLKMLNLGDNIDMRSITGLNSDIFGLGFTASDKSIISTDIGNRINFHEINSNTTDVSLKGNNNPATLNALLHLPILSIFANPFTTWFFTKSFMLNNMETLTAMDISDNKKLTSAGGTGFRSGYYYKFLAPRMLPVHIIDNELQRIDKKLPAHYISVDALAFNTDGKILASAGHDYKMTGETLFESQGIRSSGNPFKSLGLARNYNEINSIKIWDIDKSRLIAAFENKYPVKTLAFRPNTDTILFADEEKNVVMFDYKTNIASLLQKGMGPLLFLDNGRDFLYQDPSYSMKLTDISTKTISKQFTGHTDKITSAVLINKGKKLVTGGWDGTLRLWDVEKGSEIATFYAMNENDFLIKTPDNYYYATKNAVSEIGFTFGMKFYPFEQFDLKYNRPDIVLKQIGGTSPALIAAYNRAYLKRIRKLGFTEEMLSADFHVPEVTIVNSDSIERVTDNKTIKLKIKAVDSKYMLDRLNIWINDVAVFGKNGIDKRSLNTMSSYDEIELKLASGINRIQVSALNQKGAESLKDLIEIDNKSSEEKPDLYLVSIGVSKYLDQRFNLNYASKDASDISALFRGDTSLYRNIYVKTLTDEQVTASKIDELRSFFINAGRDDVVMLFVAGHGLLDSNLDYYFGTYDMDFNDPGGKGLIYESIEALFDGLNSLRKILFMDTCFSGEVDKDEMELAQTVNTEFGGVTFRSAGAGVRMKEAFGTQNTTELMKELFTDIRKGTGSTVISSAGGAEFAMEGEQWKNGLFTFCILNGINKKDADLNKDGKIMLSELQDYVRSNVSRLSDGKQSPTSRIQNVSMDFRIW